MHILILGMTESGKSSLAKKLAAFYNANGVSTIVCDPLMDPDWNADLEFTESDKFLEACKASQSCALFVDESGQVIGRYAKNLQWLATQSRHWGHSCHFIAQRASMLDKTIRDQCGKVYVFRVSKKDAETLAEEFTDDVLLQASELAQGEYITVSRFGKAERRKLFTPSSQHQIEDNKI